MQIVRNRIFCFTFFLNCAYICALALLLFFVQHASASDNNIQGQIVLADQSLVDNASIYIIDNNASLFSLKEFAGEKALGSDKKALNGMKHKKFASTKPYPIPQSNSCVKPLAPVVSFTCSDKQGRFTLNLPNVTAFPLIVTVSKNNQSISFKLGLDDLGNDIGRVALDSDNELPSSRIAVVENMARMLKSSINAPNTQAQQNDDLVMDTEYLLDYGLDIMSSNLEYPGFKALFVDADGDGKLDIYNYSAVLLKTSWKTSLALITEDKKQILLRYVENGGQLFITNKPQRKISDLQDYI